MSTRYSVFTRIMGEDALSPLFRGVGQAAKSAFAPIAAMNKAVGEPKTNALGRVGTMADTVAGKFRAGLGSIASWLPALGAIGSALTLGGLIAMTRTQSAAFDGLVKSSEKLGEVPARLAAVRYSAKLANVEYQSLEKGALKLNKTMYDAATGKNKDVAALFQRMGISLRDGKGQVKGWAGSFEDIAESFKNTTNPATQAAMAVALFGKAGADMIPFLAQGRDAIRAQMEEYRRFYGITDRHADSLNRLDDSYDRLDAAGAGLATRLSAAVAPGLIKVVDGTTNWIVANRELIAQSVERKVEKIGNAFDVVASAASSFLSLPIVGDLLKNADAGTAFDIALGGLGLTLAGPLFAGVQVLTAAVWRMNAAMWANPWLLLIAGIAAAAYAVYANWGPITSWFGEQMDAIRSAFDRSLGAGLWELFTRLNPFNLIANAVNGLSKWLFDFDLFAAGARLVERLIAGIKSMLPDLSVVWAPIERGINWAERNGLVGSVTAVPASAMETTARYAQAYGQPFPPAPSPGSPAALASGGGPQKATVDVKVDFSNMPRGVDATVQGSGVSTIQTNVGRSMQDNT